MQGAPVTRIEKSTRIERPLAEVYRFYEHPENLRVVTAELSLVKLPRDLRQGAVFGYVLSRWPFELRWEALVSELRPQVGFVDVQSAGPFSAWRHAHEWVAEGEGTRVTERLEYQIRGWAGPLKDAFFVKRALTSAIDARLERIRLLLERSPQPTCSWGSLEPRRSRGWGPRDQQGNDAPTINSGKFRGRPS